VSEATLLKNSGNKEKAMYGFKNSQKPRTEKNNNSGTPKPESDNRCHIHKFGSHTNAECNAQKNKALPQQNNKTHPPVAHSVEVSKSNNNEEPDIALLAVENAFFIVHNPKRDY
jgi:hypothetical protein